MKDIIPSLSSYTLSDRLSLKPPKPRLSHSPAFRRLTTTESLQNTEAIETLHGRNISNTSEFCSAHMDYEIANHPQVGLTQGDGSVSPDQDLFHRVHCFSKFGDTAPNLADIKGRLEFDEQYDHKEASRDNDSALMDYRRMLPVHYFVNGNERTEHALSGKHAPSQDILAQWRLRRRMEEAQASINVDTKSVLKSDDLNSREFIMHQRNASPVVLMDTIPSSPCMKSFTHHIPGGPERRDFGIQSEARITHNETVQTLNPSVPNSREVAVLTDTIQQVHKKPAQRSVRTMTCHAQRDAGFQFPENQISRLEVCTPPAGQLTVMGCTHVHAECLNQNNNEDANSSQLTEADSWQWSPPVSPQHHQVSNDCRCYWLPSRTATIGPQYCHGQRNTSNPQEAADNTRNSYNSTRNNQTFDGMNGVASEHQIPTCQPVQHSKDVEEAVDNRCSWIITKYLNDATQKDTVGDSIPAAYCNDSTVKELRRRRLECLRNLRFVVTEIHSRELQALQSIEER